MMVYFFLRRLDPENPKAIPNNAMLVGSGGDIKLSYRGRRVLSRREIDENFALFERLNSEWELIVAFHSVK